MDFGEILSRAWKIVWKHKVLWIFGVLASCGRSSGGGSGGGGNSGFQYSGDDINIPPKVRNFFSNIERFFNQIDSQQMIGYIAILVIVILIIWLIMRAFSTIGYVGLIQGTFQAEQGVDNIAFRALFDSGKPFFWRIFGLNVLIGLGVFVSALLIISLAISGTVSGFGLCMLPFICLFIPLAWLIKIVVKQANIAIVVEDVNIIEGLKYGWGVFREHVGNIIVMALVLGIGGVIIGLILSVPIFSIFLPAALGTRLGGIIDSNITFGSGLAVAGLCFVGYIPILVLLDGVLRTYIESAWTLTYIRLTKSSTEEDLDLELLPANQQSN